MLSPDSFLPVNHAVIKAFHNYFKTVKDYI